ncbi:3-deoxy-manno-octulosonate cytidylyltransferase [Roseivirga sp. BDSF3-8]|uniref:3-deoxy-manno-octulosonate cytidylyltransferase n=1 Tax=Roseivirga sp. BDSF3-8 TaxID=3241598 RepID=UPI003531A98C
MKKILGIIPARYASTRFPGKPLADINGRSMIMRVYDQARKANCLEDVVVATDDERIANHVAMAGGKVAMTDPEHPSGTDRCREAMDKHGGDYDYVINIQGDEPFIEPAQIDTLGGLLDGQTELATLIRQIQDEEKLFSPNVVKVVTDIEGHALYFSRSPIPYCRGLENQEWMTVHDYYFHVGIYAYRTDVLREITRLKPASLEKTESLEQLRWLQNGYRIRTAVTNLDTHGIDTPEDLEKMKKIFG